MYNWCQRLAVSASRNFFPILEPYFKVSLPLQSQSQGDVCSSTPWMYQQSGYFLVNHKTDIQVFFILLERLLHKRHLKKENPETQCNVEFHIKIQHNTNESTNFFELCMSKNGIFNQGLFSPRQAFPLSGVHIMNHLHFTTCGVELYFTACHKLARQKSHS